ncbi:helix-turn-helix transcriptional regulator [Marinobacter arenosus]|uniref:helix-turn-helix transcriptional regulator n=1 Tax=Marinobacter arenosus TaxID=2856822 RepID=UPI001C4C5750|nr:AraC family transcriptional regulator [Marinobacter arenosus]MBW0147197.1 AraC family transcriptional regulator [Marinobacter arenosus]
MTQEKRLWLARDRALFLGELPPARLHAHAAPVLLIGLSGPLTLHFPDGRRETCHSALVDADVTHGLDSGGEYMASLYLEPDAPETRLLKAGWLHDRPVVFDPLPSPRRHRVLERKLQSFDLSQLLPKSALGQQTALDKRIACSLDYLRDVGDLPFDRANLAGQVHLSESRFNHLFRAEVGISFRRYRSWSRLRSVLYHVARDQSLTDAALNAGLHDSAHLSRSFQNMIGLAPSRVLHGLQEFHVLR